MVRGGYGVFYDRTLLGTVDNFLFDTKYSKTFTASFPQSAADPGPSNGRLPTDPLLALVTRVDQLTPAMRAYLNSLLPPGTTRRNTGTVTWDDPDRKQPYFHQITAGYEREVFPGVSASADYVRMLGRDMFLNPNLNIPLKRNTSRTGPVDYTDPFGILTPSLKPRENPSRRGRAAPHHQVRLQRLRRVEPVSGKTLLTQLEPSRCVFALVLARCHQHTDEYSAASGRQRSAPRRLLWSGRRRSASHRRHQRPDGNSEKPWLHA